MVSFAEDGGGLRLDRLAIWESWKDHQTDSPCDRELFAEAEASVQGGAKLFRWTTGVRAFAILILRTAFRASPEQTILSGQNGSAARCLVDLVRKPAPADQLNWLQYLFQNQLRGPTEKRLLIPGIFERKSNSKTQHYSIKLGSNWKGAKIVILRAGKEIKDHLIANQMADELEEQFEKDQSDSSPLIATLNLLCWDGSTLQLHPIDQTPLPLLLPGGVAVRIELNRPAHLYVIWITSARSVQPLYPWSEFNWLQTLDDQKVKSLELPTTTTPGQTAYYPLESRPGVETVIVLAADNPIPSAALKSLRDLPRRLGIAYPQGMPEPGKFYRMQDRRQNNAGKPALRLGLPREIDDQMAQFMERLLHQVGSVCPCLTSLSFVTRR